MIRYALNKIETATQDRSQMIVEVFVGEDGQSFNRSCIVRLLMSDTGQPLGELKKSAFATARDFLAKASDPSNT